MKWISRFFIAAVFLFSQFLFADPYAHLVTANIQNKITPDDALHRLMLGNERFIHNQRHKIDYLHIASLSANHQHPIAIILSCIDSRVPPEIIFDQNIGNIFVTRTAGNVINHDVLAGMEYATQVTGAKLIVVLGHESCGAVKGACQNIKLGHLTSLFEKIQPAVNDTTKKWGKKECDKKVFINEIAADNVRHIVSLIPDKSPILKTLQHEGKIKIVGAMYNLKTGKVSLL